MRWSSFWSLRHLAFMLVKAPEEPEYLQWLATKPVPT
jgi:hypothetical protein